MAWCRVIIFFIFFLIISSGIYAQRYKYSIDDTRVDRKERISLATKIRIKLHDLFKQDKQKKADKKKHKQEKKAEKQRKKAIEKIQKKQGKDKEITSGQRVYKRMKKMKRESNRINKNKTRENYFRRLFLKHKQDPVKFKK